MAYFRKIPEDLRAAPGRWRWTAALALALCLASLAFCGHLSALELAPPGHAAEAPRVIKLHAITLPSSVHSGGTFRLFVRARLSEGWHIYSLHLTGHEAPMATRVTLDESMFPAAAPWGESPAQLALDGALGKAIKIHRNEAEFYRDFYVPDDLPPGAYPISGHLWFRACDNKVCTVPQELGFEAFLKIEEPGPAPADLK